MKKTKTRRVVWLGALVCSVSAIIFGASYYVSHAQIASTQQVAVVEDNGELTAVLGSEISADSSYALSGTRRKDLDTQDEVAIKVYIKNVGKNRLEFSPGLQLKLPVDGSLLSIAPQTTESLPGGPLEPGDEQEGIAFFTTTASPTELVFFPILGSEDYVTIPVSNY